MKKSYLILASSAMILAGCANEEYLGTGENPENHQSNTGEIMFSSRGSQVTRGVAGKAAADLLGGNFIVEGLKGAETDNGQATDIVFDNYLVKWGQNTAGTTADNTNDWAYVGVESSDHITNEILNGTDFGRGVKSQGIKYWDYSTDNYAFVAYSTGARNMIATGDPASGTSVMVTKIANPFGNNAYSFTAANAADFAQCYYTDVTPVAKINYGKPVTLTFKNLSAKVRIGIYEVIPGYSVTDVKFYADNTVATPATYTAFTGELPADQDALDTENGTKQLYKKVGTDTYSTYITYDAGVVIGDLFTEATPAVADPTEVDDATFFLSGTNTFTEAGTITVSYPLLGTNNVNKNGYNKADVSVAPKPGSTTTTKTFGRLNYTGRELAEADQNIYLGRELANATMAGTSSDAFFKYVIPVSTGAALTLRCNYTLVSTDGSGETIKVWGAKAVVPANYCEWQPNYAYTYIFKISDNTNGSTEKLGGTPEGLFPITFDAVVADITDASPEQTTVTTVATPSVTTYQYGHKKGEEYKAGDIYVMSMNEGAPQTITGALIYTTTDNKATEADVIDALQMGTVDGSSGDVTGRNTLVLTKTDLLSTTVTEIPAVDGTNMGVTSGTAGKFTAVADKNYVFVYDYTGTPAPTPSVIYSYDNAASAEGATEPTDWAGNYYTKTVDGSGKVTYNVATTFTASTAETPQYYYKKYENNNHKYAVKVIKTGTAY